MTLSVFQLQIAWQINFLLTAGWYIAGRDDSGMVTLINPGSMSKTAYAVPMAMTIQRVRDANGIGR